MKMLNPTLSQSWKVILKMQNWKELEIDYSNNLISTLRFSCRPASVRFEAIGFKSPLPLEMIRRKSIPFSTKNEQLI